MTLREFLIYFIVADVAFLAGYMTKVFMLNRWLQKNSISPKDFWKE